METVYIAIRRSRVLGVLLIAQGLLIGCMSSETKVDSGLWHFNAGLYAQAIPLLVDGVPALEQKEPLDPRIPTAYVALGDMAAADKKTEMADNFYKRAVQTTRAHHPSNHVLNRNSLVHAGNFFLTQSRFAEALPLLAEAAAISGQDNTMPRLLYAIDLDNLSLAYSGLHREVEADHAQAST